MHARTSRPVATADDVRTYLDLVRLLDDLELTRPDISAPLRLTLLRAHREHQGGWLDGDRFREVVAALAAAA